mgnify:CR=1 FL=1
MINKHCEQAELVCAYAVRALPTSEAAALEAHIASCAHCQEELAAMRPIVESFSAWPTDLLRPQASLQDRLSRRIGEDVRLLLQPESTAA